MNNGYSSCYVPEIPLPLIIKILIKCLNGVNCGIGDLMVQRMRDDAAGNEIEFFALMSKNQVDTFFKDVVCDFRFCLVVRYKVLRCYNH